MATLSLRVSDEEKNIITAFAKEHYLTISEFLLKSALETIEDKEDSLLGEARMLDLNNTVTGDLRQLAEECGLNYDEI